MPKGRNGTGYPIVWTDEMDAEIIAANDTAESSCDMAWRLGIDRSTIRRRAIKLGLPARKQMARVVVHKHDHPDIIPSRVTPDRVRVRDNGPRRGKRGGMLAQKHPSRLSFDDYSDRHAKHVEAVLKADRRGFPVAMKTGLAWPLEARR